MRGRGLANRSRSLASGRRSTWRTRSEGARRTPPPCPTGPPSSPPSQPVRIESPLPTNESTSGSMHGLVSTPAFLVCLPGVETTSHQTAPP
jgi:hypothetical protein